MGSFGGEVTEAKMYHRNFEINEEGLLSESIFGPIKDYCCKCGKLSLKGHEGEVCPKCGVKCISNDSRFQTFGKITLIFPVIKPTRKKLFGKIIGKAHKHLLDPSKADMLINTSRYLALSTNGVDLKIVSELDFKNWYVIPLRITGIYSFILALRYISEYFGDNLNPNLAKEFFDDGSIMDVIKVLPPDVRPVVRDPNKPDSIREMEVNKPYTSLIQLNKSNFSCISSKKNYEEVWLKRIHHSLKERLDDELVEQGIQEYDRITARYQFYVDRVYNLILDSLSGKYGFIRSSILGKTIEFSGRAVVTIDPSLPAYKIRVSKHILYKLWFPYFLHYLQTKHSEFSYTDLFDIFTVHEYTDNKELFDEFLDYFTRDEGKELSSTIIRMKIPKKEITENDSYV
jgi:DNA-directed RNA polymerase subunit beta'